MQTRGSTCLGPKKGARRGLVLWVMQLKCVPPSSCCMLAMPAHPGPPPSHSRLREQIVPKARAAEGARTW